MGLDGVELVMEFEEAFDITITDDEAEVCITPGDVLRLVMKKLPAAEEGCLSNAAFYEIRRVIAARQGMARRRIRPSTRLESLIPLRERRALWGALPGVSPLERSVRVGWTIFAAGLVGAGAAGWFFARWGAWPAIFWFVIAAIVGWILLTRITRPLAVHFGRGRATVGDLALEYRSAEFGKLAERKKRWHENEVWHAIQDIVCEQLGVRREQVTRDVEFVKDFLMD